MDKAVIHEPFFEAAARKLGFFAKLAHVIPIDRETYLQKAIKMASYILRMGKALMVFP